MIRIAWLRTRRPIRKLEALEMMIPRWFSGWKYSAAGVPIRESQHSVISEAPPTAIPFTAAITGTFVSRMARVMSWKVAKASRISS